MPLQGESQGGIISSDSYFKSTFDLWFVPSSDWFGYPTVIKGKDTRYGYTTAHQKTIRLPMQRPQSLWTQPAPMSPLHHSAYGQQQGIHHLSPARQPLQSRCVICSRVTSGRRRRFSHSDYAKCPSFIFPGDYTVSRCPILIPSGSLAQRETTVSRDDRPLRQCFAL